MCTDWRPSFGNSNARNFSLKLQPIRTFEGKGSCILSKLSETFYVHRKAEIFSPPNEIERNEDKTKKKVTRQKNVQHMAHQPSIYFFLFLPAWLNGYCLPGVEVGIQCSRISISFSIEIV